MHQFSTFLHDISAEATLPYTLSIHKHTTVCPRRFDHIYVVTYFIKWVKTSWTYSIVGKVYTACPRSLVDSYIVSRIRKMTSLTYSINKGALVMGAMIKRKKQKKKTDRKKNMKKVCNVTNIICLWKVTFQIKKTVNVKDVAKNLVNFFCNFLHIFCTKLQC